MKINLRGKETELNIELGCNYAIFENSFEKIIFINGVEKGLENHIFNNKEDIIDYLSNNNDIVLLEQLMVLFSQYIKFDIAKILITCKDLKGGELSKYVEINSYIYDITITYNNITVEV